MERKRGLTENEIIRAFVDSENESENGINIYIEDDEADQNVAFDNVSDSEEEIIETNLDEEDEQVGDATAEDELLEEVAIYVSSDSTQWNSHPLPNNITEYAIKGVSEKVVLPPGKIIEDPVDCFNLFFDNNIWDIIVKYTNLEATLKLGTEWKNIDRCELQAYFGLLLSSGVNKQSKVNILDFWDPLFGNPIFRATMSKNRFKLIQRVIRFDDRTSRSERRKKDKLAPIRDLWEKFNNNLKKMYIPGENLTIDEQLVPFRGRVSFKQYIPSKPDKYGMKMWWICDNATSYPLFGIPYLGKEGSTRSTNLAQNIVERLCQPYFNTNRNVTFDNFFTSMPLAETLLKNGLTSVGTLRKNKKCIPKNFLPNKNRFPESNVFGFRSNMTLVSYVPKPNRAVILLSTKHKTATIDKNNKNKSEINLFYNKTKGGVDTLDQMAHNYTVRRRTNRWPLAFLQNLIDVGGIAAQVIWKNLYPESKLSRKYFLRSIVRNLVTQQIKRRSLKGVRVEQQKEILKVLQVEAQAGSSTSTSDLEPQRKKRRCHYCPPKISRTSKQICESCSLPVCMEHSNKTILCTKCVK